MALPTYASNKVSVAWSGIPFEGFAPDSFVSLNMNTDITDEEVGADGQLSISVNPDQTGTITVVLQKNSPTNIALSSILQTQKSNGGIYTAGMSVVDPSGSALAKADGAHIKTSPEMTFSSSAAGTSYTWVFFCEKLDFLSTPEGVLGGASSDIVSIAGSLVDGATDFFNQAF